MHFSVLELLKVMNKHDNRLALKARDIDNQTWKNQLKFACWFGLDQKIY